jgi:hypothetical protein
MKGKAYKEDQQMVIDWEQRQNIDVKLINGDIIPKLPPVSNVEKII